jgi:DNA-binding GntR family transcriptional regulator
MFHGEIARAAGNSYVEGIVGSLHIHVHLFRLMQHSLVTREALNEHAAIVAAVKDRDPVLAAKAIRLHTTKSQKRFAAKCDQDTKVVSGARQQTL